jgi:hypothetical protein
MNEAFQILGIQCAYTAQIRSQQPDSVLSSTNSSWFMVTTTTVPSSFTAGVVAVLSWQDHKSLHTSDCRGQLPRESLLVPL